MYRSDFGSATLACRNETNVAPLYMKAVKAVRTVCACVTDVRALATATTDYYRIP